MGAQQGAHGHLLVGVPAGAPRRGTQQDGDRRDEDQAGERRDHLGHPRRRVAHPPTRSPDAGEDVEHRASERSRGGPVPLGGLEQRGGHRQRPEQAGREGRDGRADVAGAQPAAELRPRSPQGDQHDHADHQGQEVEAAAEAPARAPDVEPGQRLAGQQGEDADRDTPDLEGRGREQADPPAGDQGAGDQREDHHREEGARHGDVEDPEDELPERRSPRRRREHPDTERHDGPEHVGRGQPPCHRDPARMARAAGAPTGLARSGRLSPGGAAQQRDAHGAGVRPSAARGLGRSRESAGRPRNAAT